MTTESTSAAIAGPTERYAATVAGVSFVRKAVQHAGLATAANRTTGNVAVKSQYAA